MWQKFIQCSYLPSSKAALLAQKYCPKTLVDYIGPNGNSVVEWRRDTADASNIVQIQASGYNNYPTDAGSAREAFKDYFSHEGTIDWQNDIVNRAGYYQDICKGES